MKKLNLVDIGVIVIAALIIIAAAINQTINYFLLPSFANQRKDKGHTIPATITIRK